MIDRISMKLAIRLSLVLFSCLVVFHLSILMGVIPYEIVWGGRLQTQEQMIQFESVSIGINLLVLFVVATKAGYINAYLPQKVVTGLLWCFVVLFSLNTVGNLFAKSLLEMLLFTPMTLMSAVLFYRMAKS